MGGTFGYIDQHSELYCITLRLHAGPPRTEPGSIGSGIFTDITTTERDMWRGMVTPKKRQESDSGHLVKVAVWTNDESELRREMLN